VVSEHVHRWVCGVGTVPVHGVCACGAERDFTNADAVSASGRQQIAIRPRKLDAPTATINPGSWSWHPPEKIRWVI
jgi:hypothetical protein